jgi:hypothetical protein
VMLTQQQRQQQVITNAAMATSRSKPNREATRR